ncbi:GM17365 [Drosophila sechellia]|uniref:GM17365 n=1 Tax=Drosophila sechellia TaxID=7238 RepID=B4I5X7_DROSE|nr:GM17365 [Drosophila sechellia]
MEQLEKAIESSASVIRKITLSKPVERGVRKSDSSDRPVHVFFTLGRERRQRPQVAAIGIALQLDETRLSVFFEQSKTGLDN